MAMSGRQLTIELGSQRDPPVSAGVKELYSNISTQVWYEGFGKPPEPPSKNASASLCAVSGQIVEVSGRAGRSYLRVNQLHRPGSERVPGAIAYEIPVVTVHGGGRTSCT